MTTTQPPPTAPDRRAPWRRLLPPVLSLVLIGAVFFWFLPQFTSIADVWTTVRDMSGVQVAVLVLAAVWNLATYQFVMVATTPGMNLRQATVSTRRSARSSLTERSSG